VEVGDKRKQTFEALGVYKLRYFTSKVSISKCPFFSFFAIGAYKHRHSNRKLSKKEIKKKRKETLEALGSYERRCFNSTPNPKP
jgi:hypothetical protein